MSTSATSATSATTEQSVPVAGPPDPASLPPGQRARRDRIIGAAIDLLAAHGYEAVQMRDVAEAGGVALGTVYRYFSSKEHLYAAALASWATTYGQTSGSARPNGGNGADAEARLRVLLRRAVRAFERSPQLFGALEVVERSTDAHARAVYDGYAEENAAVLLEALHDLDRETAEAIVTTLHSVLSTRLRAWASGRCTIREADADIQDAIGLIFGPPPTPNGELAASSS